MCQIGSFESKPQLRWRRGRDTSDVPTPVIHDGLLYLARENGVMIVMEAMSGKEVYLKRVHRNRQRASPVIADGKLYLAARHGEVCVLKLGREFTKELWGPCNSHAPPAGSSRVHPRRPHKPSVPISYCSILIIH